MRLADDDHVFRIHPVPSDFDETGRLGVMAFTLSSADKKESPPTLSVWNVAETTIDQALTIMGKAAEQSGVGYLHVEIVRKQRPEGGAQNLDVIATPTDPSRQPGDRGHCGITGLDRPPGVPAAPFGRIRDVLRQIAYTRRITDLGQPPEHPPLTYAG